jgi:NO-binding membrane sensor protein with MHYT domain
MIGVYDLKLVALSVVVAALASYTALDLAGRVSATDGRNSIKWLLGGAFSMGTGIWSMHFIGMLAFRLPVPVAYDIPINILSWLLAIGVSGVALFVVRRPTMTGSNLTTGAALMGVGICSMHYTGMAAMRMSPPIQYDPVLFVASVIIAIVASLAALWIAFQLRRKYSGGAILAKLGSAVVMGFAIAGMHYTGMAAAQFAPDSICLAADGGSAMDNATLAVIIGVATLSILAITLVISSLDAHFAAHTAKLADSLQVANEQLRSIALYDQLTGLPNRFLLEDRLAQAMVRADRAQKSFAVMFVDLDGFKAVNDTYGHRIGDDLLRAVGRCLTKCIRRGYRRAQRRRRIHRRAGQPGRPRGRCHHRIQDRSRVVEAGSCRTARTGYFVQRRDQRLSRGRQGREHPHGQRRRGHVPCQEDRAQQLPVLRPRHERGTFRRHAIAHRSSAGSRGCGVGPHQDRKRPPLYRPTPACHAHDRPHLLPSRHQPRRPGRHCCTIKGALRGARGART